MKKLILGKSEISKFGTESKETEIDINKLIAIYQQMFLDSITCIYMSNIGNMGITKENTIFYKKSKNRRKDWKLVKEFFKDNDKFSWRKEKGKKGWVRTKYRKDLMT